MQTWLKVVAATISVLSLAVFIVDKLEEEEVKDGDEECYGYPEECGQATKVMTMFVQGNNVMLMSWCCWAT